MNEKRRVCGILLHPTSLPGPYANGDFGAELRRFLDFLAAAGCRVWQLLPIGPTHQDDSPYQAFSSHAGNPLLIDLQWLVDHHWLSPATIEQRTDDKHFRLHCLQQAYRGFLNRADDKWRRALARFQREHSHWLDDYALFTLLKQTHKGLPWTHWPAALRDRRPQTLQRLREEQAEALAQVAFEQFVFFTQWQEIRNYAADRDILIFGDLPIYVSHDSADCWAHRENFCMDSSGTPLLVAGVPPDAFSATGQRWGNPLFDWSHMERDDFSWWVSRMETQNRLYDLVRIDHFRGLEACWQIPAHEETAINGQWVPSPGEKLLRKLTAAFPHLALIAEDLGFITPEVDALRKQFDLPGMCILQFAFGGELDNKYLPHNQDATSVVYTGTHDNDTSLGWYHSCDAATRHHLHSYLGKSATEPLDMPWTLIRMALGSVAELAVIPLQDILSLDGTHRMNTPGTTAGNWQWRFSWDQLWPSLAGDLRTLNQLYGRYPETPR